MGSGDQGESWEKWEALAGDVCPGTGSRQEETGGGEQAAAVSSRVAAGGSSGRTITLLISFSGVLGLGLGVTFALLLVSGELDLSLRDIKNIVQTVKALVP